MDIHGVYVPLAVFQFYIHPLSFLIFFSLLLFWKLAECCSHSVQLLLDNHNTLQSCPMQFFKFLNMQYIEK